MGSLPEVNDVAFPGFDDVTKVPNYLPKEGFMFFHTNMLKIIL